MMDDFLEPIRNELYDAAVMLPRSPSRLSLPDSEALITKLAKVSSYKEQIALICKEKPELWARVSIDKYPISAKTKLADRALYCIEV